MSEANKQAEPAPVQSMVMPFRCPTCGDDLDKEHDLYSCHRCKQAWPHSYVENGMLSDSDHPWSTKQVLAKLVEAADILLNDHDYDGHGYELIIVARDRGREIIEA